MAGEIGRVISAASAGQEGPWCGREDPGLLKRGGKVYAVPGNAPSLKARSNPRIVYTAVQGLRVLDVSDFHHVR